MQKQNFSLIETPFSNDRDNLFFHEEVFLREGKKIPFRSAEIFPIKEEPKKSILLEGLFSPSLAYRVVERSFLAPDQLLQESISSLQFIDNILNIFNFSKHVNWVFTSSKNPKMRKEEGILLTALQRVKRGLFRQEKGGKEPVIEIGIRDALHREWRGPSLCLRKGEEKYAIVERSSFGMIERWIALMIETTSLKSSPFFRQEGKGTL